MTPNPHVQAAVDATAGRSLGLSRLRHALGLGAGVTLLLGLFAEIVMQEQGFGPDAAWAELLNLSYEVNLPTWSSSMLLLTCALLLLLIRHAEQRRGAGFGWHWAGLALAFLYISMDEAVIIHEMLNGPLRTAFDLDGVLYFGWVVPVGLALIVFALSYLRFLAALPRRHAALFVAAGTVYVFGAIGTELPVSLWYAQHGGDNQTYGLMNAIQEMLEIIGVSIFCYALADYLAREIGPLRLVPAD